jgi:hypothetical protein
MTIHALSIHRFPGVDGVAGCHHPLIPRELSSNRISTVIFLRSNALSCLISTVFKD